MSSIRFRDFWIFTCFLLVTLGDAGYLMKTGSAAKIQYIGYAFLISGIWYFFITGSKRQELKLFFLVSFFFFTGLLFQDIPLTTILRLELTMFAIETSAIISGSSMCDSKSIRSAVLGIFAGVMTAALISVANSEPLFSHISNEGILKYGYRGGLEHKNYLAATMIAIISGIHVSNKLGRSSVIYNFLSFIAFCFLAMSGSKGGYILFLCFVICINYPDFKRLKKQHRKYLSVITSAVFIICGILFYFYFALNTITYMYRVRGMINYLKYYFNDIFRMVFGNASLAFSDTDVPYGSSVRATVGYDGSLELSYLGILIKNGILGLIGYVLIFSRYFKMRVVNIKLKKAYFSILFTLLLSSLVETYIVNVHLVYGIFSYILLSGIIYSNRSKYMQV